MNEVENLSGLPGSGPEVGGARWRLDLVRLDRSRVLRGWTRAELARQAHVDPGTLSDMVRGRRKPTFGTVQAVCTVLGLGLRDVIVFTDGLADRLAA